MERKKNEYNFHKKLHMFNNLEEAKYAMLEKNAEAMLQAIILRYQAFTIISGLSIAFLGIAGTLADKNTNKTLFNLAIILLALLTILSLGRYLHLNYQDRKGLMKKREEIENWDGQIKLPKTSTGEAECWLLILYIFFVVGIFLLATGIYFPKLLTY